MFHGYFLNEMRLASIPWYLRRQLDLWQRCRKHALDGLPNPVRTHLCGQVRLGLVGCLSERLLRAVFDLRDAGQSMADYAMPPGWLRDPGAWVVDTRLLTAGAAPTAALDRAKPSLLMPSEEDATPARLQSLSAVARGGGTASRTYG